MRYGQLFEEKDSTVNLKLLERQIYVNMDFCKKAIISYNKMGLNFINDIAGSLNIIKKNKGLQPSQKIVESAIIWTSDFGNGKLIYKSAGGTVSEKMFESQLSIYDNNDKLQVLFRGGDKKHSNTINDVYIHTIDVEDFSNFLYKNLKDSINKLVSQDIESTINICTNMTIRPYKGKRYTIPEWFKAFEGNMETILSYKDIAIVELNKYKLDLENKLKKDDENLIYTERKLEIIEYMKKLLK